MVLIALKSQYVSLIVTIISGASELALLWAALGCNTFLECVTLRKGGRLNVRNHRLRTKFLTIFATNVFIILEVFNSFYSDPATIVRTETRTCTSVRALSEQSEFSNFTSVSNLVYFHCLHANRTTVWLNAGNLFVPETDEDVDIQCSDDRLFEFERAFIPPDEPLPESGYVHSCVVGPAPGNETFCVFVYRTGNRVTFTLPVLRETIERHTEQGQLIGVWHTDVFYDVTGLEEQMAIRAADAFAKGIFNEDEIRRQVFTGDGRGDCDFKVHIDATAVSLAFIYALGSVWVFSFLAFALSFLFRSQSFFDMSDPLHWAQKAEISQDLLGAANPVISNVRPLGQEKLVVSNSKSAPDGDQWGFARLRRMRRGARTNEEASNANNEEASNANGNARDGSVILA